MKNVLVINVNVILKKLYQKNHNDEHHLIKIDKQGNLNIVRATLATHSNGLTIIQKHNLKNDKQIYYQEMPDKYMAISHVWKDNWFGNDNELFIKKCIKEVIIDIAKQHNLKYIWIDKFCINQENNVNKNDLLAGMGQIYSGAYIVCILTIETMMSSHNELTNSAWITRGWTLQEGLSAKKICVPNKNSGKNYAKSISINEFTKDMSKMNKILMRKDAGKMKIHDCIELFAGREFKYNNDYIYALIGLIDIKISGRNEIIKKKRGKDVMIAITEGAIRGVVCTLLGINFLPPLIHNRLQSNVDHKLPADIKKWRDYKWMLSSYKQKFDSRLLGLPLFLEDKNENDNNKIFDWAPKLKCPQELGWSLKSIAYKCNNYGKIYDNKIVFKKGLHKDSNLKYYFEIGHKNEEIKLYIPVEIIKHKILSTEIKIIESKIYEGNFEHIFGKVEIIG